MIFFDVTKLGSATHRSGLARLSERLRVELGPVARPATWQEARDQAQPSDWFVTSELFSEHERPGVTAFIASRRCRTAAIFADAIPMKFPQITWPQSVARHPHYMKMLAGFERVWAISDASRGELEDYWRWLGLEKTPRVEMLPLGADFDGSPRTVKRGSAAAAPSLLCVGILEPRKNQSFLLDVCAGLWDEGVAFELHVVGRVNPHFGRPIVERIKTLQKTYRGLKYHAAAKDEELARLYGAATATIFPTIAEGCGLPVLESLWRGVPSVCSDLPVLRENTAAGGCVVAPVNDHAAWRDALKRVIERGGAYDRLAEEARTRRLPTWAECAELLRAGLA